jgi:hypothetical protein
MNWGRAFLVYINGWWFGTFLFVHHILEFPSIPTDELTPSFFRGVGQPPNSVYIYINLICSLWKFPPLSSMLLAINLHGQFGDFSKRGPRLMTPEGINPYSIKLSYGNIPLFSI